MQLSAVSVQATPDSLSTSEDQDPAPVSVQLLGTC